MHVESHTERARERESFCFVCCVMNTNFLLVSYATCNSKCVLFVCAVLCCVQQSINMKFKHKHIQTYMHLPKLIHIHKDKQLHKYIHQNTYTCIHLYIEVQISLQKPFACLPLLAIARIKFIVGQCLFLVFLFLIPLKRVKNWGKNL